MLPLVDKSKIFVTLYVAWLIKIHPFRVRVCMHTSRESDSSRRVRNYRPLEKRGKEVCAPDSICEYTAISASEVQDVNRVKTAGETRHAYTRERTRERIPRRHVHSSNSNVPSRARAAELINFFNFTALVRFRVRSSRPLYS